MKGKTVVVTGGTSGIGEVAAEKLAEMGARIVLVARDRELAESTICSQRKPRSFRCSAQPAGSRGVRRIQCLGGELRRFPAIDDGHGDVGR
jgi:NAD(P)-dependent dehydrogenase (short-subunit alcohol dehydrogenase family)